MPFEEMGYSVEDHDVLVTNKTVLGELVKRHDEQQSAIAALEKQLGGGIYLRVAMWALGALWTIITGTMLWLVSDHLRVSGLQQGRLTREEQLQLKGDVQRMQGYQEQFERRLQWVEQYRVQP